MIPQKGTLVNVTWTPYFNHKPILDQRFFSIESETGNFTRQLYLYFAQIGGFHKPELQLLDMSHRIVNFVTRLRGQATIIRKTVELLDYFITSIVHVLSFWLSLALRPVLARYRVETAHSNSTLIIRENSVIRFLFVTAITSVMSVSFPFDQREIKLKFLID